jgi:hypothetical protein
MSLEIRFRGEARDEFLQATAWYERRSAGLGAEFVAEVGPSRVGSSFAPSFTEAVIREAGTGGADPKPLRPA